MLAYVASLDKSSPSTRQVVWFLFLQRLKYSGSYTVWRLPVLGLSVVSSICMLCRSSAGCSCCDRQCCCSYGLSSQSTTCRKNFLESTLCRTGTFHTTAYQLVICQPCLHHIVTTTGFDQTLFAISDKLCTITCHFLFPCYVALVPEVTAQFFFQSAI